MRFFVIIILFLSFQLGLAQEKPRRTLRLDAEVEAPKESPTGYELPKIELPRLTPPKPANTKLLSIGDNTPPPLDITKGDGLLDYKTNSVPKFFKKDKVANKEYGRDQNLGEVKTSRVAVNVAFRDHEAVDGDQIMVLVNGDVVRARATLSGSFQGIDLPLILGANTVEFIALNQGESGPNTAELHVYDDQNKLISAREWNLLTGYKATFVIIKDK